MKYNMLLKYLGVSHAPSNQGSARASPVPLASQNGWRKSRSHSPTALSGRRVRRPRAPGCSRALPEKLHRVVSICFCFLAFSTPIPSSRRDDNQPACRDPVPQQFFLSSFSFFFPPFFMYFFSFLRPPPSAILWPHSHRKLGAQEVGCGATLG
ncbi:hypothetical protein VUR80DRAFT_503 [Thermomyces stellatus]